MGLNLNKTIDEDNLKILDITLFLAQQNPVFRGHREDISSKNRGFFRIGATDNEIWSRV